MSTVQKTYITIRDKKIPAKIYRENRRNVRASIGKNAAILRMPRLLNAEQQREQLKWFTEWVDEQFEKNDNLSRRFHGRQYKDGDTLVVGEREYLLRFEFHDRKTHHAKLHNQNIVLQLSKHDSPAHLQKSIRHLLSRVVAKDFHQEISRRVMELNQLYFQKEINSVNLKFNQSNWGSCSSKRNVNLSTRLLFAPATVIDYVIIHELAHLIEMNHSKRFWALVATAMPDYKEKEKWLRDNGRKCDF